VGKERRELPQGPHKGDGYIIIVPYTIYAWVWWREYKREENGPEPITKKKKRKTLARPIGLSYGR
jgi:hypothetical protein